MANLMDQASYKSSRVQLRVPVGCCCRKRCNKVSLAASRSALAKRAGPMVATALPRDKTVMTSPLAASRSRLEKWRLASPAAMVFTADPQSSVEHYFNAQRCESSRAIAAHAGWASCLRILKHPPQRLVMSQRVVEVHRPAALGARSAALGTKRVSDSDGVFFRTGQCI